MLLTTLKDRQPAPVLTVWWTNLWKFWSTTDGKGILQKMCDHINKYKHKRIRQAYKKKIGKATAKTKIQLTSAGMMMGMFLPWERGRLGDFLSSFPVLFFYDSLISFCLISLCVFLIFFQLWGVISPSQIRVLSPFLTWKLPSLSTSSHTQNKGFLLCPQTSLTLEPYYPVMAPARSLHKILKGNPN